MNLRSRVVAIAAPLASPQPRSMLAIPAQAAPGTTSLAEVLLADTTRVSRASTTTARTSTS